MGIQIMQNDNGFLLDQMGGMECFGRFHSRELYNSPFCIRSAVMGFLNSVKFWKTLTQRKAGIPFLLQTSLSLSCLLHNSMSQELFEEASKQRNKKQEEKRKLNRKMEGNSPMISFTLSIYSVSKWRQTLEMGLGDVPPPPPFISAWQKIHQKYVFVWSWVNNLNLVA